MPNEFDAQCTAEEVIRNIDLNGKNIIVTGANSGIGKESARVLALHGAYVILACRNVGQGKQVVEEFSKETPALRNRVEVMKLDLSNFDSIRVFAAQFKTKKIPLHILILNAGIMAVAERTLVNGHELQFATNHLGHFLLTLLLVDELTTAKNARVVVVSSQAHEYGPVDFGNITFSKPNSYQKWKAYSQSKTANILFANALYVRTELNRRFQAAGLRITANSLHPGVIETNLGRHMNTKDRSRMQSFDGQKNVPQGAATQIYLATAPELEGKGGLYFSDCKITSAKSWATDPKDAAALWSLSEKVTGVSFPQLNSKL